MSLCSGNRTGLPVIFIALAAWPGVSPVVFAQEDGLPAGDEIEALQPVSCFGFSDIEEPRALAICDALSLGENVRARELGEQWLRAEPDSPAAQFALAEVLFRVEGNMPRALFHLQRAEALTGYQSVEAAFESGNVQWHYLTLSQLSNIHQLMGEQRRSLDYLDQIENIYGQDLDSFRGWPLLKLKQYDAARASANRVLENSESERERERAWNTLCAVELASLRPIASMSACEQAIQEDGNEADSDDYDTVYLSNASEVALSLLRMDEAEDYLNRATRYLNPNSTADPWIYLLYLTMNQARFDEARTALDRMMIWRRQQEPVISAMNRAEHFVVSATFLLLAGYAEDAARLSAAALNQPDRNGSFSADDAQKDSQAALLNMMANAELYQMRLEDAASMGPLEALWSRLAAQSLRLRAWRAERRAASLFADFEVLQNRVRPYAPLDVHIPEWVEPEIIGLIGTGVMASILEQALDNGAFELNRGYYHAWRTEIAAHEGRHQGVLEDGQLALGRLPHQEALLRARVTARVADAWYRSGRTEAALPLFEAALRQDPGLPRRLGLALPVTIIEDGSEAARLAAKYLRRSPRFQQDPEGLLLELGSRPELSICLKSREGAVLNCTSMAGENAPDNRAETAADLTRSFHRDTFGLGYDISKAQRSILLGSSVILSSRVNDNLRRQADAALTP